VPSSPLSPWLAVDALSDRTAYAHSLRRVYDAFHAGKRVDGHVRAVVAQSWARSGQAGVNPVTDRAPIVVEEEGIADRWQTHPLFGVLPVLRQLLSDATTRAGHMLVISDARGVLLWIEGHRKVIEATEDMHFVTGADWSEAGAGTNALGTAIAVDHPVQIFSAEHFSQRVHRWQCSGAPIHDPETGEIIGVVDLTGHLKTAHPHTLSLVTAAAGMAEAYLGRELERETQRLRERYVGRIAGASTPSAVVSAHGRVVMAVPAGWIGGHVRIPPDGADLVLPDGTEVTAEPLGAGAGHVLWRRTPQRVRPAERGRRAEPGPAVGAVSGDLGLTLLSSRPTLRIGERMIRLSPRQAELLAVLALWPDGFTSEQLTLELYGEAGKTVTIRAELSRLRRLLGPALESRPYRLRLRPAMDFEDVEAMVKAGQLARALEHYPEPLLPASEVDLVVEARDRLDGSLRSAVMTSADPDLLAGWCATASGRDDRPAAELLLSLLDADDPRRAAALARAQRLRRADPEPALMLPAAW
jgi:hypothetical protein